MSLHNTDFPVIYVAGKYRVDNPSDQYKLIENIERARNLGIELVKIGVMPIIPHMNTAHMEGLNAPDFFIKGTMELLRRSDAVLVQPINWETSTGTRGEIAEAKKLDIPVFWSISEVKEWLIQNGSPQAQQDA